MAGTREENQKIESHFLVVIGSSTDKHTNYNYLHNPGFSKDPARSDGSGNVIDANYNNNTDNTKDLVDDFLTKLFGSADGKVKPSLSDDEIKDLNVFLSNRVLDEDLRRSYQRAVNNLDSDNPNFENNLQNLLVKMAAHHKATHSMASPLPLFDPDKPYSSPTPPTSSTTVGTSAGGTVRRINEKLLSGASPDALNVFKKAKFDATFDNTTKRCTGVSISLSKAMPPPTLKEKDKIAMTAVIGYVRLNGLAEGGSSPTGHKIPISGADKELVALTYLFCKTEGLGCKLPAGEEAATEKYLLDKFKDEVADLANGGTNQPIFGDLIKYCNGQNIDITNIDTFDKLHNLYYAPSGSATTGYFQADKGDGGSRPFFNEMGEPKYKDPQSDPSIPIKSNQEIYQQSFDPDTCTDKIKPDPNAKVKSTMTDATSSATTTSKKSGRSPT